MKPAAAPRDFFFDNLKAILIFLVVLGHFAFYHRNVASISALNNAIYAFHMPLFIFVSGYFSKKVVGQRRAEIVQIAYPYLAFQIANLVFNKITGLGSGSLDLFQPVFQNWYLAGMFFWRLCAPYFNLFSLKTGLGLLIAVVIAMVYTTPFSSFLDMYRVLYFMPFFVVGYRCGDLHVLLAPLLKWRWVFIAFFACAVSVVAYFSFQDPQVGKLLSYAFTPMDAVPRDVTRFVVRVAGLFASAAIAFSFLFLVPQKRTRFAFVGQNTLTIFLVHMFVVWPIDVWLDPNGLWFIAEITAFSAAIAIVLGLPAVNRLFAPLTNADRLGLRRIDKTGI